MLAIAGGICGLVFARWSNALLERSLPMLQGVFPVQLNFDLDWRVITFATVISLATTVLCGLLPAWRASRTDGLVAFKGEIVVGVPEAAAARTGRTGRHVVRPAARCGNVRPGARPNADRGSWLCRCRPTLRVCVHLDAGVSLATGRQIYSRAIDATARASRRPNRRALVLVAADAQRLGLRRPPERTANTHHDRRGRSGLLRDDGHRTVGWKGFRGLRHSRAVRPWSSSTSDWPADSGPTHQRSANAC